MAVGSFSAGLSGLNANSTYLSVIGNNLANINTIGFKASAVSFADLVSQTVGGTSINPMQVGLGVVTGSISPVFSQGSIENSREATNVAIQGAGFFVGPQSDAQRRLHARRQLQLRQQRHAGHADGWRVQGYTQIDPATGNIVTTGQPDRHHHPARRAARADRDDHVRAPGRTSTPNAPIDPANPEFTTSVQIYDALGARTC